ncbi:unnamed protein product [Trichobilharzia szidati]|nr:unnamed protein product [Trichobilharzia szidati]
MTLLKVLCLHGYRQNADIFREKTGGFRKSLKKFCEFSFLCAPNMVENSTANDCAWWFSNPQGFSAQEYSDYDAGLRESLAIVKKHMEQEGPFDGIIGFSQGAAFLLMLQIIMEHKLYDFSDWNMKPIKFTVLIAPFLSRCSLHKNIYAYKSTIPSLIVCGKTDSVISREMTDEILDIFSSKPRVFLHDGGHYIPTHGEAKQAYTDFISSFIDQKL